jgi:hypothetical protein
MMNPPQRLNHEFRASTSPVAVALQKQVTSLLVLEETSWSPEPRDYHADGLDLGGG